MNKILIVILATVALAISVIPVIAGPSQIQTRTGVAIVIDTKHYLDIDGDGQADIYLDFGPPWYEPISGAQRPNDGDTITVTGKLTNEGTPDAEMDVYEINGLWWRDPGRPPWARGPKK
ncbi:MAG: hypothetical protein ACE5KD_02660 [Candidatus Bathyarchaeia archaeon]